MWYLTGNQWSWRGVGVMRAEGAPTTTRAALTLLDSLKFNQQTMGTNNCTRTMDVTYDNERRPTTTETRVEYDNSTWYALKLRKVQTNPKQHIYYTVIKTLCNWGCKLPVWCFLSSLLCMQVKSSQVNVFTETLLGRQREKKTMQKSTKPSDSTKEVYS